MLKADFTEFETILSRAALLTATIREKNWDELVVALFQELSAFDIEPIRVAVSDCIGSKPFFPMLADIKTRLLARTQSNIDHLTIIAWSLVWDAIGRFGHTTTLRFPHAAFHFAIGRLGGWGQLCATATIDNEPFKRRDFEKRFSFGLEVSSWDGENGKIRVPAYLMGSNDISNRANGFLSGSPRVIDAVTGQVVSEAVLALPDGKNSGDKNVFALISNLAQAKTVKF